MALPKMDMAAAYHAARMHLLRELPHVEDLTVARAIECIGADWGVTSKMPCPTYSLSAQECGTGSKLRTVPGSVCASCYACRGSYLFPSVQKGMDRRMMALMDSPVEWTLGHIVLQRKRKPEYFRWHDSGDLQSRPHLIAIILIAEFAPWCQFWLPTKEVDIVQQVVSQVQIPKNLTIRISHPMVDRMSEGIQLVVEKSPMLCESVVTTEDFPFCEKFAVKCPATFTDGHECGDCRTCWNPGVQLVAYKKH